MQHARLGWILALGGVVGIVNCGAEPSKLDKGEEDDESTTNNNGQGGTGGLDFGTGASNAGGGSACTDATCIGNNPQGECDTGLAIGSPDAMDGARAIGICQAAQAGTWGVVSAEWVRSDGQPLTGGDGGLFGDGTSLESGKGILGNFGNVVVPREGQKLLALSSGSARNPGEPEYHDPGNNWKDSTPHGAPGGYPKESPSCDVMTGSPYDSGGLRLTVRTPTDAKSFQFEFNFYTYEYPDWVCTTYNDFFVAMLTPVPQGLVDGNISFDSMGNTISVNAGFLEVCNPSNAGGKTFACSLGYSEILGTGFDSNLSLGGGSAATSWLVTTAPIENPGSEITLHFAIWDSGDGSLDSTVLIDNFRFELEEGQVGTVPVPE